MSETQKTCFVIIGYGPKMDYATGRELDLDKTFDYIIKPAFEELGFLVYRSSDLTHSGVIDIPMYNSILKSDFVLADLSTLNANVLYELGIRHAVRKNTTIIISEKELSYPFDLNHILIEPYEHLGKAIDYAEVLRFKKQLQDKVKALIDSPQVDSPLYTLFPDLEAPTFTEEEIDDIKENIKEDGSLSDFMSAAEDAKNKKDYPTAVQYLEKALALKQDNLLVTQRLALVTYKSETPTKHAALNRALAYLEDLNPLMSIDLETLGLSGAIHKRLFEIENNPEHLKKSIWFYEKGFYIGSSYYNGINLAFLFNVNALQTDDKFEAVASFGNATRIRSKVREICESLFSNQGWDSRDDKEWILLTMAEIEFSIGNLQGENEYLEQVKKMDNTEFALDSYYSQRKKLEQLINAFNNKYKIL
jgi:tetratricopeptide (TPR) repeat protein